MWLLLGTQIALIQLFAVAWHRHPIALLIECRLLIGVEYFIAHSLFNVSWPPNETPATLLTDRIVPLHSYLVTRPVAKVGTLVLPIIVRSLGRATFNNDTPVLLDTSPSTHAGKAKEKDKSTYDTKSSTRDTHIKTRSPRIPARHTIYPHLKTARHKV